jgi:hypothetical protein
MATRTGKSFNFEPSGKNVSKMNYSSALEAILDIRLAQLM